MSIHLIGRNYGVVPEGATQSVVERQQALASEVSSEVAAGGALSSIIWLPQGLEIEDERQRNFVQHLQTSSAVHAAAELLEVPIEDLKTIIYRKLAPPAPALVKAAAAPAVEDHPRVYILCDQQDLEATRPLEDYLFGAGFEVILPFFDEDEAQARLEHEENLRSSDVILLYYGAGDELWLRRKLRELQKSAALGREKPWLGRGIYVGAPATPQKERFRTHEAMLIHEPPAGFDPCRDGTAARRHRGGKGSIVMSVRQNSSSRIVIAIDATADINPFPGLRPFEPDEDYLFFGRERQTDELLKRLRTTRFLSILGRSGSGKSSLVRSGLIPSLHGGAMARAGSRWRVAIMRPGEDPIGNLAAALSAPEALGGGADEHLTRAFFETTLRASRLGLLECVRQSHVADNVLVLVDQFEEIFRYKSSRRASGGDEAAAFVKLLLAARESELPVYIAITMRSDFIGDCMEFGTLPEALNEGIYLVPRMTREELRLAITGPVAVGGATIAPRLVSRLLNDVGDDPDQLPILQHALMRTWERWQFDHRRGEPLDLRHYEDIGTMHEALSRHAEEAFGELDALGQLIAEKMFKALTDKASDPRGVRRPAPVREICAVAHASLIEVDARRGELPQGWPVLPDAARGGGSRGELHPRHRSRKPHAHLGAAVAVGG